MIGGIQDYYLGQDINDAKDVVEYTGKEYQLFKAAPQIRKNEKMYLANNVNFAGFTWDTVIGSTEGKIYKIAIQIMSDDNSYIRRIFMTTHQYLTDTMGKYTEHRLFSNRYIWDSSKGNVLFNTVSKVGYHGVNVILTATLTKSQLL
jgi:hypothetical protein